MNKQDKRTKKSIKVSISINGQRVFKATYLPGSLITDWILKDQSNLM